MSSWAYLDENHNVIVTDDMKKTALENGQDRTVAIEKAGDYSVSTVFLGLDHGWDGVPMWFETMLFGAGPLDQTCERCTTWNEALVMHQRGVKKALRASRLTKLDEAIKNLSIVFSEFATTEEDSVE